MAHLGDKNDDLYANLSTKQDPTSKEEREGRKEEGERKEEREKTKSKCRLGQETARTCAKEPSSLMRALLCLRKAGQYRPGTLPDTEYLVSGSYCD